MTRSEAGHLGGLSRAAQPDYREHMRRIRALVSSESCAANGRKGYAATRDKYGFEKADTKAREWRLLHPSAAERAMMALLADLEETGYEREREVPIRGCRSLYLDFAWPERWLAIEVWGRVHTEPALIGERRDEERLERLRRHGWRVLIVLAQDVAASREVVAAFLRSGEEATR